MLYVEEPLQAEQHPLNAVVEEQGAAEGMAKQARVSTLVPLPLISSCSGDNAVTRC